MCPRFYATLNYDLVVLTNRLLFYKPQWIAEEESGIVFCVSVYFTRIVVVWFTHKEYKNLNSSPKIYKYCLTSFYEKQVSEENVVQWFVYQGKWDISALL